MSRLRDTSGRPDVMILSAIRLRMLEGAISSVLDGVVPETKIREHLSKYLDRVCKSDEEFIAEMEARERAQVERAA